MKRKSLALFLALAGIPAVYGAEYGMFDPIIKILPQIFKFLSLSWLPGATEKGYAVKAIYFIVLISLLNHYLEKIIKDKKPRGVVAFGIAAISIIFMPENVSNMAGTQYGAIGALLLMGFLPGIALWNTFKWAKDKPNKDRWFSAIFMIATIIFSAIGTFVGIDVVNSSDSFGVGQIYSLIISALAFASIIYLALSFGHGKIKKESSTWENPLTKKRQNPFTSPKRQTRKYNSKINKLASNKHKFIRKIDTQLNIFIREITAIKKIYDTHGSKDRFKEDIERLTRIFLKLETDIAGIIKNSEKEISKLNILITNPNEQLQKEGTLQHISQNLNIERQIMQEIYYEIKQMKINITKLNDLKEKPEVCIGALQGIQTVTNQLVENIKKYGETEGQLGKDVSLIETKMQDLNEEIENEHNIYKTEILEQQELKDMINKCTALIKGIESINKLDSDQKKNVLDDIDKISGEIKHINDKLIQNEKKEKRNIEKFSNNSKKQAITMNFEHRITLQRNLQEFIEWSEKMSKYFKNRDEEVHVGQNAEDIIKSITQYKEGIENMRQTIEDLSKGIQEAEQTLQH